MALGRYRTKKKKFMPPRLQITSMMDMFTIILIFLLFSFSNDPSQIRYDKDLRLPKSTAKVQFKNSIRLVVSRNSMKLENQVIARLKDGKVMGMTPGRLEDSKLYHCLKSIKKADHGSQAKDEQILFLCDRRLSFDTINAIIKTAGMAGYPNFQFGVLKK